MSLGQDTIYGWHLYGVTKIATISGLNVGGE
jgi:hypothetical protein